MVHFQAATNIRTFSSIAPAARIMLIQNSILINGLTPQPVLGLPVALDSLRFLAFKLLNRKIVLKRCRKDAVAMPGR
jgi:hypothetical protein